MRGVLGVFWVFRMIRPVPIPGLFITGTDTGVGKTIVTGAIAAHFRRRYAGKRIAVCKPIATGCVRRREGLVSEDAEFLAHCGDVRFDLDTICPRRYAEPLAPAIAAERAGKPVEWDAIDRSLQTMSAEADVMLVEGVGGVMVPLDARHTVLDLARWLRLPAIVVARPGLGTINHTLLTLAALRAAHIRVAGVVINRYPAQSAPTAEETNPAAIERFGKTLVLCVVPDEPSAHALHLSPGILSAIDTVDWDALTRQ
jgi:dethiobiotin synthetase